MFKYKTIIVIFSICLSGYVVGADANYSIKQAINDSLSSLISGKSEINCVDCEAYLLAACKHVTTCIDQKWPTIKQSLADAGRYVMHERPYFSHGIHGAQFDPEKYNDKQIPICSKCIVLSSEYTPDGDRKYPIDFTRLEGLTGLTGGSMSSTSHQGRSYGSVYDGMTPLWQDVFTTIKENPMNAPKLNFLELGSGFNIKPLALWGREQGKMNCTVNDINSDKCLSFIKRYLLIDPRDIKASHEQSFIILDQGDFLEGKFSTGQKFDVVVITNVFHYFTKKQADEAMRQLKLMTKPDSIVYIQAFSGTDENHEVNPFLEALGVYSGDEEPLFLDNAYEQINKFISVALKKHAEDQAALTEGLNGSENLPDIAHRTRRPFSFYPVASLKKMARDHGFLVITSGLFQITTPSGGTSGPQKTPYFAWVKLKKL